MRLNGLLPRRAGSSALAATLAVVVGASSLVASDAVAQGVERRTIPGDDVAIYNLVGEARVRAGTGSQVVVEITRGGTDADELEIETGEIDDRSTLRVVYPRGDIVYRRSENSRSQLHVNADGTFGGSRSGGRRVTISGRGSGTDAHADLEVRVPRGKKVALYLGVGMVEVSNVDGDLRIDVASASVTAEGVSGSLFVDTGSGEVRVEDMEGNLTVDSGSGGVSLTGVRGKHLLIDTGSGDVTGSDIEADELDVDVGSGNIRLARVSAPTSRFDSGSGNVDVSLAADVEQLRIDTGSGSVTLAIPASLGAQIAVETGSGGIDTDVPISLRKTERRSIAGTIGDGRGHIEIDTGSGGVKLVRTGAGSRARDR